MERYRKLCTALVLALLFALLPQVQGVRAEGRREHAAVTSRIWLRNRTVTPAAEIDPRVAATLATRDKTHALVQLQSLPRAGGDDVATLKGLGIELLDYLQAVDGTSTTYVASLSGTAGLGSSLIRAVVALQPVDKIDPRYLARPPEGSVDSLVQMFADVSPAEAQATLARAGVEGSLYLPPSTWRASLTRDQIGSLASEDAVQMVQPGPPPFMPTNDEVRQVQDVDDLQRLDAASGQYLGLTGRDVEVGIVDTGVDAQHNDFSGRFVNTTDDGGDHGTHVAGIAAGSGFQSDRNDDANMPNGATTPFQWRGMAPQAGVGAYTGADWNDMVNNDSIDTSNHSYVLQVQGQYDANVAAVDSVIRGDTAGIPARPVIWAAANNGAYGRTCAAADPFPNEPRPQYPGGCPAAYQVGYFSILAPCKNCIVVGSVYKNETHRETSGMGPTMDGRLKPDVMAVGVGVTSTGANTDGDGNAVAGNGYRAKGGTSMAAPAVTGITALMLQAYGEEFGVDVDTNPMRPSTFRSLLIHGADDQTGTDASANADTGQAMDYGAGPDFLTGYGNTEAEETVGLIRHREFLEDSLSTVDHTDEFQVPVVPGQQEVKISLAWDDLAGSTSSNDAAPKLVNDLDLVLVDPNGNVHRPLVMPTIAPFDCDGNAANGTQVGTCAGNQDPAAAATYEGPATEGTDRLNNSEQVVVTAPGGLADGMWTARVTVLDQDGVTTRLPLGGSQPYSLVGVSQNDANLRIDKLDDPDPVKAGEELVYTVRVSNDGPDRAHDVTVRDVLPDEVDYVTDTGNCVQGPERTLTCDLGDIAPNASKDFQIDVAVHSDVVAEGGGSQGIVNHATVLGSAQDPNMDDNSTTEDTIVQDSADLEINKVCDPATVVPAGETAECTLFVDNHGPSWARDVVVDDQVDSDGAFTVGNIQPSQGTCTPPAPSGAGQRFSCNLGDLEPATGDEDGRATVTYELSAVGEQDIDNTATVRSNSPDPDDTNNRAEQSLTIRRLANLGVDKSAPGTVVAGTDMTFEIDVTNDGPSTASNAVVEDFVPAGVAIRSVTATGGDAACNAGVPGDPFRPTTCTFASLPAGAQRTMFIDVRVLPDTQGILHNDARITGATFDPDNSNDLDHTDTTVQEVADLSVTKSDSPDPVVAGTPLDYTVRITNAGPSTAREVTLTDELPGNVTFNSAEISNGSGVCEPVEGPTNKIECELNDLDPSEYVVVFVHTGVKSAAPDGSTLHNVASATTTATDPNAANSQASASTLVRARGDLQVVNISDADVYKPSATVAYTVTATNHGPSDSQNARVVYTLPNPKDAPYFFDTGNCTLSGDKKTLTCPFGTVTAGQTKSINVYVRVKGNKGVLTSIADLSSETIDPIASNNTSTRQVMIKGGV